MTRSKLVLAALAATGALSFAVHAEAGIVVRKDGSWVHGHIQKDPEGRGVWVRWPYLDNAIHAKFLIETKDVRWFHADEDEPTKEYWDQFRKLPIDPPFVAPPPTPKVEVSKDVKDLVERERRLKLYKRVGVQEGSASLSLLKPEGWRETNDGGVLMLVGDPRDSVTRVRPRIHIFSYRSVPSAPSDQVEWMRGELRRSGPFEVSKEEAPRVVRGGFDYTVTTRQTRDGETVVCLRRVFFREGRTWCFCAYACEADYPKLAATFEASLRSVVVVTP
jgi:hypothetical protein